MPSEVRLLIGWRMMELFGPAGEPPWNSRVQFWFKDPVSSVWKAPRRGLTVPSTIMKQLGGAENVKGIWSSVHALLAGVSRAERVERGSSEVESLAGGLTLVQMSTTVPRASSSVRWG